MKGRRIRYSRAELVFVRSRKAMPRRALHAAFVTKFRRRGITVDHIRSLCARKGWVAGRKRWRRADDALLRELYPHMRTSEVARRLGRTLAATYGHADKLGLAKSEAYLASPAACRLRRGDHVGAAFRFQKGHVPANKGLRRQGWSAGRMKETQFKKGQPGWNWRPLGSERLVDGYRYTKVSDRRRVPWTVNWKPTHVLKWEAKHGRIPRGHALLFRDGDRTNVRLRNLKLITRRELMLRNSVQNLPAPLRQTIQLLGALNRKINRRSPSHEEQDRRPAQPPVRDAGGAGGPGESNGDRTRESDRGRGACDRGFREGRSAVPRGDRAEGRDRLHRGRRDGGTPTARGRLVTSSRVAPRRRRLAAMRARHVA
jgi:hypothetical protein